MNRDKPVIIAIDDQPVILHTIASELKEAYHVKAFTAGDAALNYLSKQTADLIILDYEMPGMNGLDVLERLRSNPDTSKIPVVFLTGSSEADAEPMVLESGAADYIQKPIKVQVLLTRIRLQLELARYRNHLESLVREQTEHLHKAYDELRSRDDITLDMLAEITDMRDHDTGGHLLRVTKIVRLVVDCLQHSPTEGYILTGDEGNNIIRSAKLHDLGKIAIPDHILLKPGKLSSSEFEIIKSHTLHGAELFDSYIARMQNDSFFKTARDIAKNHHEKWDGTGYPCGLKGTEIPLPARITALADVYDALTSERPYKKPFSHSDAINIIKKDSGTHFDPFLVTLLLEHEKPLELISAQL